MTQGLHYFGFRVSEPRRVPDGTGDAGQQCSNQVSQRTRAFERVTIVVDFPAQPDGGLRVPMAGFRQLYSCWPLRKC